MHPPRDEAPAIAIVVTRTGGFAGLRRQWRVEPPAEEAARWVALIDRCPWDDVDPQPPVGADLFAWHIRARCVTESEEREHDARLQDPQVEGPWRDLIDEVRNRGA